MYFQLFSNILYYFTPMDRSAVAPTETERHELRATLENLQ